MGGDEIHILDDIGAGLFVVARNLDVDIADVIAADLCGKQHRLVGCDLVAAHFQRRHAQFAVDAGRRHLGVFGKERNGVLFQIGFGCRGRVEQRRLDDFGVEVLVCVVKDQELIPQRRAGKAAGIGRVRRLAHFHAD